MRPKNKLKLSKSVGHKSAKYLVHVVILCLAHCKIDGKNCIHTVTVITKEVKQYKKSVIRQIIFTNIVVVSCCGPIESQIGSGHAKNND